MARPAGQLFAPQLPRGLGRRLALGALLAALVVAPAAAVLLIGDDPAPAPPGVRVEEVDVGALPTDIAIAQGRAWVPSAGSDELVAIDDRPSPERSGTYRASSGALRVASDGLSIWLAGAVGNRLTAVDPLFGGEADRHRIAIGTDAVDLAVGRDAVWVSNGAAGTVTRIDPVTERPVGPRIRTGRFPTALAVGSHDVWVVNSGDGTVTRIDPRENLVVGKRVPVGRDPQDIAIGFGSVWVANRGDGTVSRLSERTGRPQARLELGGAPTALAITTGGLVVLDSARGRVVRVDPRTLRATDTVRVGGFPNALAVGDEASLWTVDARRGAGDAGQPLALRQLHDRHEELVDLAHDLDEAVEVDRLGDVGVRVQLVGAQHVLLGLGRREHDDGDLLDSSSSALTSASTSRPSLRGRLRSSRTRSGRGISAYSPSWRRNASASTPSDDDVQAVADLVVRERLLDQQDVAGVVLDEQHVDDLDGLGVAHAAVSSSGSAAGSVNSNRAPRSGSAGSEPDAPAVKLDDLAAHRKPDAGALVGVARVQPLEDDEDALGVLVLDADAVVGAGEVPEACRRARPRTPRAAARRRGT